MTRLIHRTVVFRLLCPEAQWVSVAGDFNGWSTAAAPMRRDHDGTWLLKMRLKPGTYRFRYFTSTRGWVTDWAAFGVQRNAMGDWDSILHVPAGPRRRRSHQSLHATSSSTPSSQPAFAETA